MKCPYCGRDVLYSDRFCKCGAELDMVVCPNCGTPNITLATFCGNCGHLLTNAEPYKPEEEPEEPEEAAVPEEETVPEEEEPVVPEEKPTPEETAVPKEETEPAETIAPEEEPEPAETTMADEEPEPEETAAPEEEPATEEMAVPEEEPEPEEAVVPEEEPVTEEIAEESAAPEEEPATEEMLVPEEEPEPEEAVVPEEEPVTEEIAEEAAVPEEGPAAKETLVPEEEAVDAFAAETEPEEAFAADAEPEAAAASEEAAKEVIPPDENGNRRRRRGGFIVLWIVIAIIVVLVIVFAVLYTRGNREETTPVENTENLSDADTETEEDLAEDSEEEEEMPAIVSDISFERVTTDNKEYAVVTGKEDDGNIIWEYTTPEYEMAELDRVSDIGLHGGTYYIIQGGAVLALDKSSGDALWENSEYGGSPVDQSWAFGDNGLYLCGYEGPAIYGVSYEGDTLGKIEAFDNLNDVTETNLWPYKITVSGREAMVYYGPDNVLENGANTISENEATVYSVNLDTWEYSLISNGAAKVETTSGNTGSNAGTGDTGSGGSGSDSSGSGSGSNGGGTSGSGSGSGSSVGSGGGSGSGDSGSSGGSGGGSGSSGSGSSGSSGSGSQPAPAKVSMSDVKDVTASSYLYEANVNISHDPKYLVDGTLQNAWCEDASGDGIGQWATVSFNGTYTVSGMNINAGYQKSESLYYENCRPKEITITFSDGSSFNTTLEDVDKQQTVAFSSPVSTSSVTITIRSVYKGSKYEDTCISEVAFY